MNPTPSNTRSNRTPPTSRHLINVLPRSGVTASSIATNGRCEVPKYDIDIGAVVHAYVYMDSIFFAADVQSQLANPGNLEDERTLHEKGLLERQGDLIKLRPCVVMGAVRVSSRKTHYHLCPMAGFHDDGSRQRFKDLKEPASLLVRPVQATNDNETFGDYVAYQFTPEWKPGPQYLFPVKVMRDDLFVANHRLPQFIDTESYDQLGEDIKEVSNVWKKWRKAEHVTVEFEKESQWLVSADPCVINSLFSSGVQIRMGHTRLGETFPNTVEGEALHN